MITKQSLIARKQKVASEPLKMMYPVRQCSHCGKKRKLEDFPTKAGKQLRMCTPCRKDQDRAHYGVTVFQRWNHIKLVKMFGWPYAD